MATYRVLVGLDYGKRAEAGDIVTDLPAKSVTWLVSQGLIEKVDAGDTPSKPEAQTAPAPKTREQQSPNKKGND